MNSSLSILLLEDEVGIRSAIARALELRGHRVQSAETVEQALQLSKKERFEILITDLRLEKGDGISALMQLRQVQPQIRPILMTGYGSLESAIEAIRLQAIDYLIKPFRLETLIQAVEKVSTTTTSSPSSNPTLPYAKTFECAPKAIQQVELELAQALRNSGMTTSTRLRVLSATSELIENCVQHAYSQQGGPLSLRAQNDGEFLTVEVQDFGKGFESSEQTSFLLATASEQGIAYVQSLVEDLDIESAPGKGTLVRFRVLATNRSALKQVVFPSNPTRSEWVQCLDRIENAQSPLWLDFSELDCLPRKRAAQLRMAMARAEERGIRFRHHGKNFPQGVEKMLAEAKQETRVRQALWA